MFLSVIIAVYNMEKWIDKCLQSITSQYGDDLEIVIVNDGSDDSSQSIIDGYAEKDKRIITIQKENGGIASAIEAGLEKCSGTYVTFLDADDYYVDNYYAVVKGALANGDYDILQYSSRRVDENGNEINVRLSENGTLIGNDRIIRYHYEKFCFPGLATRIYKRELFKDLKLLKQNIGIDELVTLQVLSKAESFIMISDTLYNILVRMQSISRNVRSRKKLHQLVDCLDLLIEISSKNSEYLHNHYIKEKIMSVIAKYGELLSVGNKDEADYLLVIADLKKQWLYIKIHREELHLSDKLYMRLWMFMNMRTLYCFTSKLLREKMYRHGKRV